MRLIRLIRVEPESSPVLRHPPLGDMGSLAHPFEGKRPVNPLDFHRQLVDVEVLDDRRDLVRVDLHVAESPFDIVDQGDHQTVGLIRGPERKPRTTSVHDTKLPILPALLFASQRSNHGLTFVQGSDISGGVTSIISERSRFNQQVENGRGDLAVNDRGFDGDGRQFRVCENKGDMEVSDAGVVIGCNSVVVRQRETTGNG